MPAAPAASAAATAPINLLRGWPAPSMLPVAQLKRAMTDALSDERLAVDSLLYGPDAGIGLLREQLARYLSTVFAEHGAPDDPERICITGGASQNVANILQSFTDPDYTACIWVSAPCYFLMCPIFEDSGFAGRLRAVPEDEDGADAAALERGFLEFASAPPPPVAYKTNLAPERKAYRHIVYLVPASSNPTGRSTTLERRRRLVRLARRHDALLIADDVYDLLQWDVPPADVRAAGGGLPSKTASVPLPPPLPRLVDLDRMLPRAEGEASSSPASVRFGNAISNGSFSKIVAPGMRTGWVEGTPAFSFGLAQTGSTKSGGAPSQFCAAAIAVMMRSGALDRYLCEAMRPALQLRHRLLVQAVETHLSPYVELACGGLRRRGQDDRGTTYGGYFLWLKLRRADISATAVAARALAHERLVVAEGPLFKVKGDERGPQFDDHIRLCFAWEDEANLEAGVRRLARVLRDWDEPQPASPPHDNSFSANGLSPLESFK